MAKYTVVITDSPFPSRQPYYDVLTDLDCDIVFADVKDKAGFLADCAKADGMIVCYAEINEEVIDKVENCKIFARVGIAVNNINMEKATSKGIYVTNVVTAQVVDVANHAITLLLASAKKIVLLNNAVKSGQWDLNIAKPVYCLTGKTLGLAGFGGIAREVARRMKAFDVKIMAFDPYVEDAVFNQAGVERVGFTQLLEASDYLSVHMPLNKETKNMFSYKEFDQMKKGAFLINTARGGVIDETALIDALGKGKIAGAGLDVLSTEFPGKDHPLFHFDNVIITPHSAYFSEECNRALQESAANEVKRVLTGEKPISVVNRELLSK